MIHLKVRAGLTLVEVLVLLVIAGILFCLFMPATRSSREAARRMTCSNSLRQIGLAVLNYESKHKRYPYGWGGPAQLVDSAHQSRYFGDGGDGKGQPPIGRWSGLVPLLPYLEVESSVQDLATKGFKDSKVKIEYREAMAPWNMDRGNFTPWRKEFGVLRCPSDPGRVAPEAIDFPEGGGRTNYGFCYGDEGPGSTDGDRDKANRGMFQGRYSRRAIDVTDGLAYTILLGEIATSPSSDLRTGKGKLRIQGGVATNSVTLESTPMQCKNLAIFDRYPNEDRIAHWRGMRWGDGAIAYTGFHTILSPNSASCSSSDQENDWGFYSLSSYHGSGAHSVFGDGNVKYIPNSVDTGNLLSTQPTTNLDSRHNGPSLFGPWGAMGTYDAGDTWDASAFE